MLVITQKIRTAKGADHILLLEEGKVSAYGTHDELMKALLFIKQLQNHSRREANMMNFIRKPFGYEPIITKEDLKKDHKKKVDKASDWKGVLKWIWNLVDEQRFY